VVLSQNPVEKQRRRELRRLSLLLAKSGEHSGGAQSGSLHLRRDRIRANAGYVRLRVKLKTEFSNSDEIEEILIEGDSE
jgi:hypothetical protein